MTQLKSGFDRSIAVLGQYSLSAAKILWRRLPNGFRTSLILSTPTSIYMDRSKTRLEHSAELSGEGITNSIYMVHNEDELTVYNRICKPENYTPEVYDEIVPLFLEVSSIIARATK